MPLKVYLVSAKNGEFVGFTDKLDADFTSDGRARRFGVPTIGDAFRDSYDGDGDGVKFPIIEIELTDAQVKQAKIKALKAKAGGTTTRTVEL